ncbi:MAG TPA: GAF domain-containing protein [Chloroflexia bacterium]|nr:GAF domain-containing protein [Chloroflexia bacterium]
MTDASLLATLTERVHASLDLPVIGRAIYTALRPTLPTDGFYLALIDESGTRHVAYLVDPAGEQSGPDADVAARDLCGAVAGGQSWSTATQDHGLATARDRCLQPGMQSGIVVAIAEGEQVIGALAVQHQLADTYARADVQLLERVAARVAPAIANAWRYHQARQKETRYRTLLEEAADAVFVMNPRGRYVEVNEGACALLGYTREELLRRAVPDVLPALERAGWESDLEVVMDGRPHHLDRHLKHKDGRLIHVALRVTMMPIGGQVFYQAICRDLSEHDALEAARDRERVLYLASIRSLAATVDARDAYTHSHSQQVAFYCRLVATELGLGPEAVETIELAGLLHDIGKIAIPDTILQKPSRLTPEEWAVMRTHAAKGADILSAGNNPALAAIVPMVRHHHERWDGGGYPGGLAGEATPLGAAVIAVADAFDTITTVRPYKPPSTLREGLAEIQRSSGSAFHPGVVAAFLRVIARDQAAGAPYLEAITRGSEPIVSSLPRLAAVSLSVDAMPGPQSLSYQEQQRLAAHMHALYAISRSISDASDGRAVAEAAAELAQVYLGAECVYLLELQDSEGQPLGLQSQPDEAPAQVTARWGWQLEGEFQPFTVDAGTVPGWAQAILRGTQSEAVQEQQAVAVAAGAVGGRPVPWRSGILIPLRAGGQSLGALGVGYPSRYQTFTSDDLELADTLGAETARALAGLQWQRAERQLRRQIAALEMNNWVLARRSRDMTALHETAQSLAALQDVDTLCRRVVEVLDTRFGYTLVSIALLEGAALRFQAWSGYDRTPAPALWPLTRGITGRVARSGRPELVPDVTVDPDYYQTDPTIRSEICVPLIGPSGLLGVLNIESSAPDPLDRDDLQLLITLAPQIAIALQNARLYAAARQQTTHLALVNRVAHAMTGLVAEDVDTLLGNAVVLLQRELGYAHVSILLVEPATAELVCHATVGDYAAILPVGYRLPVTVGMVGWVARHGRTLVANDVTTEPHFYRIGSAETPAAEAVVPLSHGGQVIGVLDVESAEVNSFAPGDVQLLETLGDQLAVALAQSRLVQAIRRRVPEQARATRPGRHRSAAPATNAPPPATDRGL